MKGFIAAIYRLDVFFQAISGGVLGFMVKPNMYVEAGYRALGQDYNQDGLTYDMITHGALFTMGVTF